MLEMLHRLAIGLAPWRPLLLLVLLGSLVAMAVQIFRPVLLETSPVFILALVGMLWSLAGFMLTACFQQVPERPESIDRFFSRLRVRLKRFGYWLLAGLFLLTSLAVIVTTFRLLRIYLSA